MKVDIWIPIYVKDYLADTSRLSTIEHGAYLLLLFDYWINGSLPNDRPVLLQICKLSEEKSWVVSGLLEKFFKWDKKTNKYRNKRIDLERERAIKRREDGKKYGKLGGGNPNFKKNKPNPYYKGKDKGSNKAKIKSSPAPAPSPIQSTSKSEGKEIPPSLEAVVKYCGEKGKRVDPVRFFNHYESNGWLVGKNKMKNWHAAVATWEGREKDSAPVSNKPPLFVPPDTSGVRQPEKFRDMVNGLAKEKNIGGIT